MQGVRATWGRQEVLRGVDLELRPGELVALMGRNGSGKTTLLRLIAGFHRPERGRVLLAGQDTASLHPAEIAQQVGKPRAARAVGGACGSNRVGILVPCHRVLASDGSLGGFGWGLKCKQDLLAREGHS